MLLTKFTRGPPELPYCEKKTKKTPNYIPFIYMDIQLKLSILTIMSMCGMVTFIMASV